jgi:hypothetical protein
VKRDGQPEDLIVVGTLAKDDGHSLDSKELP